MWAQGRRCSTGGRRASTGRAAAAGRSTRWGACWAVPRGRLPRRAALCSCSCCGWGGGWAPCLTNCWASVQASGVRAPRRASSTAGCSPRPPPPLRSEASASPPMSSPASASPPMSSPPAAGPHPPARSEAGAVRQVQAARDHWKAGARRGGAEGEGGHLSSELDRRLLGRHLLVHAGEVPEVLELVERRAGHRDHYALAAGGEQLVGAARPASGARQRQLSTAHCGGGHLHGGATRERGRVSAACTHLP